MRFTKEEIDAAKSVKDQLISGSMSNDLKSIYMAGEICMWDEMNSPKVLTGSHPEDNCTQCGKQNPLWSAENDLWNEVNGSPNGILCPACFSHMAAEKGIDVYLRATRSGTSVKGEKGEGERKYPIAGYAPGSYQCKCVTCEKIFTGDKRAFQCEPCAEKMQAEHEASVSGEDDQYKLWETVLSHIHEFGVTNPRYFKGAYALISLTSKSK